MIFYLALFGSTTVLVAVFLIVFFVYMGASNIDVGPDNFRDGCINCGMDTGFHFECPHCGMSQL